MPSRSTHSIDTHKKAFEKYYELRSFAQVETELDIDKHTLRRWARGEIACDCPYHHWEQLIAERDAALEKRQELLDAGIVDPLSHEQALLDAQPSQIDLSEAPKVAGRVARRVTERSDLERLSHFEFIYAKLFFHITGCVIDHGVLMDMANGTFGLEECRLYFEKKGLEPRNLEQCVKTLITVTDKINEIRESLGLRKAVRPVSQPAPAPTLPNPNATPKLENSVQGQMALEDLRRFKERIDTMSPEEVRAVADQFKTESDNKMTIESPVIK